MILKSCVQTTRFLALMQTLYGSEEHSEEVCTIEVDPLPIDVAGRSLTLSLASTACVRDIWGLPPFASLCSKKALVNHSRKPVLSARPKVLLYPVCQGSHPRQRATSWKPARALNILLAARLVCGENIDKGKATEAPSHWQPPRALLLSASYHSLLIVTNTFPR
jgi:hypothetical protein